QAQRIEGAQWLPNRRGTAPGQWLELEDGHLVALLPGPPRELVPMVDEFLLPKLQQWADTTVFHRFLHVVGLTESEVEDRLFPWLHGAANPSMATYIDVGEVLVRVSVSGEKAIAAKKLEEAVAQAREALGEAVYAVSNLPEEGSLVSTVEDLLAARGETLSVAESCTGGWIAKLLTDQPGSSRVFLLGAVSYSNQAKEQILGVDPKILASEGAVSEPVARQMAEGVRNRAGSTYAIATTGIAGPEGGSLEKPVGLVYTAIATPQMTQVFRDRFRGERDLVRIRAAKMALSRLRLAILRQG
ncbi:MAG: nicotinamide-nucleotide amidohydrolase family protein, partial [Firmicutes bacterium]|nr:nicotinamide-nucleotide amidohydrolase family protein [Bacillota bacterium]